MIPFLYVFKKNSQMLNFAFYAFQWKSPTKGNVAKQNKDGDTSDADDEDDVSGGMPTYKKEHGPPPPPPPASGSAQAVQ